MRNPPGVHAKHGSWYLVRRNKWTRLCRQDEGEAALYLALAKVSEQKPDRLALIFPLYLAMAEIRPATRKGYANFCSGILLHTFGHMRPDDVTDADIAMYLERRKKEGAPVAGNRERACLSSVFEFAMRNGFARHNPCRGISRNTERPRKTLVTNEQLQAAIDKSSKHFGLLLAFAYATGMRREDIMGLRRADVREDGIHWTESKTGKPNHMTWTPWLREIVRGLEAHADEWAVRKGRVSDRLLTNRWGRRWTPDGIAAGMRLLKVQWTFRDLRAKAETDSPGTLGHVGQMQERYRRARKLRPVA